jgi:Nif-specific regulatory protein
MAAAEINGSNTLQVHSVLLIEVAKIMAKPTPSQHKITQVLCLLAKWAQLHFGRVLLPNYQTGDLEVAYSFGLSQESIDAGQYTVKFGQGLTGYAWRSGQVALVTDVVDESVFLTRIAEPIQGSKHHVGFITVPIMADGKAIGVLSAQRRANPRRPYADDVNLLRVIAVMIGSVLQLMQRRAQSVSFNPHQLDRDSGRWLELCESHGIIGASRALLSAVKEIDMVKDSDAPIMVLGESGTGKEMFARMTHRESRRCHKPFVCINCASIPETLLESELFGHEKGSFTGAHRRQVGKIEQAHEGTLFLDEIGDMPMDLQAKLLRVLQDKHIYPIGSDKPRHVDFRIITATHVNLAQAITEGRFRLDLYYRLNVIPITLPALRERQEDIPRLAQHFLCHYCEAYDRNVNFTQGVHERLQQYSWPGNIRQLQNLIERVVLQADGPWVTVDQIIKALSSENVPNAVFQDTSKPSDTTQHSNHEVPDDGLTGKDTPARPYATVRKADLDSILDALKRTGGNQVQAARLLNYTPRQLRYRLQKLQQKENCVS